MAKRPNGRFEVWKVPESLLRLRLERGELAKLTWAQLFQDAGQRLGSVVINYVDLAHRLGTSERAARRSVDRLVNAHLADWASDRKKKFPRLKLLNPDDAATSMN